MKCAESYMLASFPIIPTQAIEQFIEFLVKHKSELLHVGPMKVLLLNVKCISCNCTAFHIAKRSNEIGETLLVTRGIIILHNLALCVR